MRALLLLAVLAAALAPAALAQAQAPAVNVPGRGLQAQPMPPPAAPPGGAQLQPGQFLPAVPPAPGSVAPPSGPAMPSVAPLAPVQTEWVAQGGAELRGTDKVTARTSSLVARVGEPVRFGPLTVVVRSCVVRPADRVPDAAAYLEISEGGAPPLFRGWMVLSLPQLALVEHPTHDIRLARCLP